MKKTVLYILAIAAAATLSSCNNWLDITPEDTTIEKQLFSDAGGYHSAINGLYQTMASSDLYGQNLSWGFICALSQYYDNKSASNSKAFSYTEKYEYGSDEVKAYGEQIWQTGYNVIANANNILKHLETADKNMFPEYQRGEVDLIKGEALAVRALMHFELLRLFGVSPKVDANQKAIPYVSTYPSQFNERKTVAGVLTAIENDFEQAADLVAMTDTVYSKNAMYSSSNRFSASNSSRDFFFSARGVRLNYVGIKSLLARVYAYAGNIDKAFELAKYVDDNYITAGADAWYNYTTSGYSATDTEASRPHKGIDEILFAVYDENLATTFETATKDELRNNSYALKNLSGIFADNDDYRLVKLVHTVDMDTKTSLKYRQRTIGNFMDAENKIVPVMKISELHFIMAEYYASKGQMDKAAGLINKMRIARGCKGNSIAETISAENFATVLNNEIWRENVAEGQYFFYLKRTNAANINNNGVFVPMDGKYTLEIPDSEIALN